MPDPFELTVDPDSTNKDPVPNKSPDANPYLLMFSLINAGLDGIEKKLSIPSEIKKLPSSIHEALEVFEKSSFMKSILGGFVHKKYSELKTDVAVRSPRELGSIVKTAEVIFHHEIRNQFLWGQF